MSRKGKKGGKKLSENKEKKKVQQVAKCMILTILKRKVFFFFLFLRRMQIKIGRTKNLSQDYLLNMVELDSQSLNHFCLFF